MSQIVTLRDTKTATEVLHPETEAQAVLLDGNGKTLKDLLDELPKTGIALWPGELLNESGDESIEIVLPADAQRAPRVNDYALVASVNDGVSDQYLGNIYVITSVNGEGTSQYVAFDFSSPIGNIRGPQGTRGRSYWVGLNGQSDGSEKTFMVYYSGMKPEAGDYVLGQMVDLSDQGEIYSIVSVDRDTGTSITVHTELTGVYNIRGPQGPQGIQGIQGPQGVGITGITIEEA